MTSDRSGLLGRAIKITVASVASVGTFGAAWVASEDVAHLDQGSAQAIGGVLSAIVASIGFWWATIEARPRHATKVPTLPRPVQLPGDVDIFFGRVDEQRAIRALATSTMDGDSRIQIISGPPGMGKSTLAVHVAHSLLSHFQGGLYYVNLRAGSSEPLSAEQALEDLLVCLGLDLATLPKSLGGRSNVLRARLNGSGTLILLDNAASSSQIASVLPGDRSCFVLITARSGMYELDGAARLALGPLEDSEAVEFLERTLGAARIQSEASAAVALAHLCNNMPLALRILSAKLQLRPTQRLVELQAALESEQTRLSELHVGEMAIRGAFEMSYRSLSQPAQQLFRTLSLLPAGAFTPFAAASVSGYEIGAVRQPIDELLMASLLQESINSQTRNSRYLLHDLIRIFASELEAHEETSEDYARGASRLVNSYFGGLGGPLRTREGAYSKAVDLEWLFDEAETLVHCVRLCRAYRIGHPHKFDAIVRISQFLEGTAQWARWEEVSRSWVEIAMAEANAVEEARARRSLARVLREFGQWSEAEREFVLSVDKARASGDLKLLGQALRGLGTLYRYSGQREDASIVLNESAEMLRLANDRTEQAWTLRSTALLARDAGEFERALDDDAKAERIFREVGDKKGLAATLRNIGIVQTKLGNFEAAESAFDEALDLLRELRDPRGEGSTMRNVGDMYKARRLFATAEKYVLAGLALVTSVGDTHWEAASMRSLGELRELVGDTRQAAHYYEAALERYRILGDIPRIELVEDAQARLKNRSMV